MDVKEKLTELINDVLSYLPWGEISSRTASECADYLIKNGVTFVTDNNVGGKWIPVTERKPDLELVNAKSDDVDLYMCLVTIEDVRVRNGRYVGKAWYDGEQFIDRDCMYITSNVTHWMPLPVPPKGE